MFILGGISSDIWSEITFDSNVYAMALLQFRLKLECCKPHNAARHLIKCEVINDVKMFPTLSIQK